MSDDDDMGSLFRDWKEQKQARRAANRLHAPQLLKEAGIAFTVHNGGAHLVVEERVDFWPGTGLWKPRASRAQQRGVRALIRFIQITKSDGQTR